MPISLLQFAAQTQQPMKAGLVERITNRSEFLKRLKFITVDGLTYQYNRREALPGIAFRGLNANYSTPPSVINPQVESLAIFGGEIQTDAIIYDLQGDRARMNEISGKVINAGLFFDRNFIKGDPGSIPGSFPGLNSRLTGSQLLLAGTNGGNLTLEMIDAVIDQVVGVTASSTNYIEVNSAGVVSSNTAGFTAGRYALYTVVTGSASITSVAMSKTLIGWTAPGSITGALLSTAASSRSESVKVGTLTATSTYLAIAPCTGTLTSASIVSPLAVAQSDTNYWTVSVTNLGQANAGTQALLAATAANTTKATGGNAMAVNVPLALALPGTSLAVNDGDVLAVTFTATAAPTPLTGATLRMKFSFSS